MGLHTPDRPAESESDFLVTQYYTYQLVEFLFCQAHALRSAYIQALLGPVYRELEREDASVLHVRRLQKLAEEAYAGYLAYIEVVSREDVQRSAALVEHYDGRLREVCHAACTDDPCSLKLESSDWYTTNHNYLWLIFPRELSPELCALTRVPEAQNVGETRYEDVLILGRRADVVRTFREHNTGYTGNFTLKFKTEVDTQAVLHEMEALSAAARERQRDALAMKRNNYHGKQRSGLLGYLISVLSRGT